MGRLHVGDALLYLPDGTLEKSHPRRSQGISLYRASRSAHVNRWIRAEWAFRELYSGKWLFFLSHLLGSVENEHSATALPAGTGARLVRFYSWKSVWFEEVIEPPSRRRNDKFRHAHGNTVP
jgi:hypothetical protein